MGLENKKIPNVRYFQGTHIPTWDLVKAFGIYVLILFVSVVGAYASRLKHVVCAFFFYKRSKTRTLHLYNDMLKKRKGYLKHMRHKVRREVRCLLPILVQLSQYRQLVEDPSTFYSFVQRLLCSKLYVC